jgi:thioredoxin reductase (NADPH)
VNVTETDVVIVGAGPVGLFGVFQCGMLRMQCHVVDSLAEIGGQCTALYPDKPIYDIPGLPGVNAGDLIGNLVRQAAPFLPIYHLGQTADRVEHETDGRITVTLSSGVKLRAAAVILAAGGGTLRPNRPPLEGVEGYEGRHVIYRVDQIDALRGRHVVIAGGGDSAVDWANALEPVAASVTVVHRRPRFRAAPASVEAMMASVERGRISLATPCQLHSLEGDGSAMSGVVIVDDTGTTRTLAADTLLALFGISPHLGPLSDWPLALDGATVKVKLPSCETTLPGVYAVGDIAQYEGKLKLILTGFAEVAAAAHAIYPRVHPNEVLHFEHSTTRGVPASPPGDVTRQEAVEALS